MQIHMLVEQPKEVVMLTLHTEWTTDWACRLVRPIEVYVNANWPVVWSSRYTQKVAENCGLRMNLYEADQSSAGLISELERLYERDIRSLSPLAFADHSMTRSVERPREWRVTMPSMGYRITDGDILTTQEGRDYLVRHISETFKAMLVKSLAQQFARIQNERGFCK
jgi:hypothetical protein